MIVVMDREKRLSCERSEVLGPKSYAFNLQECLVDTLHLLARCNQVVIPLMVVIQGFWAQPHLQLWRACCDENDNNFK